MPHLPLGDSGTAVTSHDAYGRQSYGDMLARVLLVDDMEADILLTRRLLFDRKGLNCTFEYARTSEEAFQRLISAHEAGRRFDLVLLDIGLPGEDGYALLQRIRNSVPLRATIVIMLTGSGDVGNRSQARLHGAIGYMTKPPSMEKLRPILEYLPMLDVRDDRSLLHIA
jgi:CheY-like chemotaxis protein